MGFWDQHIADLEALGFRFSRLEVGLLNYEQDVTDRGTLVLRLGPIFDPQSRYGVGDRVLDRDGEMIHVAEIIEVADPYQEMEMNVWQEGIRKVPLYEYVDNIHGGLDSPFPSYFGVLEEPSGDLQMVEQYMRAESYMPYPFWACMPLGDDMHVEAARRLVAASEQRVLLSGFGSLMYVLDVDMELEGMSDCYTLWRSVRKKAPLGPEEARAWADFLQGNQMTREHRRDVVQQVVTAVDELFADGIYELDGDSLYSDLGHQGLNVPAIEEMPQMKDDFMAVDMWKSIEARIRFTKARAQQTLGTTPATRSILMEAL